MPSIFSPPSRRSTPRSSTTPRHLAIPTTAEPSRTSTPMAPGPRRRVVRDRSAGRRLGPETEPGPIRVDLFGTAHVEAWGEKIASGLRSSAYELLAWYALHPHGATAEAAIEALWPDTPPKRGRERFWNALGNLRSRLHGPNEDGVEILTKIGQLYHPDPSVLDIDLWRFESALDQAAQAGTPEDLIVALGRASACYGGDFYPTGDALWVEPVREDLHRRALDTQIRLAELYVEADQADAAIAALERAIELDSICEDAYRRLITLQSHVGREDAAKRTWVLLQGRLAELDLEPEATTFGLVHEVLGRRPTSAGRPVPPNSERRGCLSVRSVSSTVLRPAAFALISLLNRRSGGRGTERRIRRDQQCTLGGTWRVQLGVLGHREPLHQAVAVLTDSPRRQRFAS